MPEGKELAKTQWLYLMGALTGGLLVGAALGAYVIAPAIEKKKARKLQKLKNISVIPTQLNNES